MFLFFYVLIFYYYYLFPFAKTQMRTFWKMAFLSKNFETQNMVFPKATNQDFAQPLKSQFQANRTLLIVK